MGAKCQFKDNISSDANVSNYNLSNVINKSHNSDKVNHDILHALCSVISRLTAIEQCIGRTEEHLQKGATSLSLMVSDPLSQV